MYTVSRYVLSVSRRWWFVFSIIVIAAGLIRLTGYNFKLPFLEQVDEAYKLTEVLYYRGLYAVPDPFPGYPPGSLALHYAAQLAVEAVTQRSILENPSAEVAVVRVLGALAGTLATLFTGLLARRLAGDVAGWLAAMIFAVLPQALYHGGFGLPEVWLYLFHALTLYAAAMALPLGDTPTVGRANRQDLWAIASVIAAILGIIFKYSAALLLLPGFAVTVYQVLTANAMPYSTQTRRKWLVTLALQLGLVVCTAGWLIFGYQANRLVEASQKEAKVFVSGGVGKLFNLTADLSLLQQFSEATLGLPLWLGIPLLVLGTIGVLRTFTRRQGVAVGGLAIITLANALLVITYVARPELTLRYLSPSAVPGVALCAVLLIAAGKLISAKLARPVIGNSLIVACAALWLFNIAPATWAEVSSRLMPDTRPALAAWATSALGPGAIITENGTAFSREWGGYTGPYRVWLQEPLTSKPLSEWRALGVGYADISEPAVSSTPHPQHDYHDYLDNMLRLKQFPPANKRSAWQGPTVNVYSLWKPQYVINEQFGGQIALLGYDILRIESRKELSLQLYWQARRTPTDNYNVFVHLVPQGSDMQIGQADGAPAGPERLTLHWTDPDEVIIGAPLAISIPDTIQRGKYCVKIGLYNYSTGRRLPIDTDQSRDYYQTCGIQLPLGSTEMF